MAARIRPVTEHTLPKPPGATRARRPIRPLSTLVASQIAAGEVVERPASVVKELVDNALDSGATRIIVEIERGGIELVRVVDDGCGIPPEELPLAIAPHATSKITDAADLDRVATMGFRGEALASIASVSRLSIRSRAADDAGASLLEVEGDRVSPVRPEAGPVGTTVTVRNLFFNTPARRKFLRTPTTEHGHCVDQVRDLAMAHPHIGFTLRADGRTVFELPTDQGPRDRALDLLGREFESQYIEAHADEFDDSRGVALWGLVGLPSMARTTTKGQHVFLNGRPVRDRTIQHAIKEAYRGLIEPAKHPAAVLALVMDPGAVDVNVHPAKSEVRFRDSGLVHSVVLRAIRDALRREDLTPSVSAEPPAMLAPSPDIAALSAPGGGGPTLPVWPDRPSYGGSRGGAYGGGSGFTLRTTPPPARTFDFAATRDALMDRAAPPLPAPAPIEPPLTAAPVPAERILQVHNSYLVTQDEHGIVIIDQHALHERVMFEKLRDRIASSNLESQRLLMPAVLSVPSQRMETLAQIEALLTRLGIEAAPMGPGTIAVQAFPTFLFDRGVEPGPCLAELLERAEAERWGDHAGAEASDAAREAALHEALDMMACKAAIKAGDALSQSELTELLAMRERVERASNCPHGRPTTVRVTIRELERLFGRS